MRKKISLILLSIVIGVSLAFAGSLAISPVSASSARTIDMKYGVALGANTVITTGSGILYRISGYASSATAVWAIHNTATIAGKKSTNIMAEGGEATQYDSFPPLDFGSEGLPFTAGLMIYTTTATVAVQYK